MDYMREINAFYDWLETNSLSANAVLTWYALMHTNNKCFWTPEFRVAISVLSHKTGGISRRSIERARNELQQKGLIAWKEMPGNQSASYRMVSLVRLTDVQHVAQPVVQVDVQHVAQPVVQVDAITSYPSGTQKTKTKTKTKTNTYGADALTMPTRFVRPDLSEVVEYCKERRNSVDARRFCDYYEANGWRVGKNPMKDWKAAVRTWERGTAGGSQAPQTKADEFAALAEKYKREAQHGTG